MLFENPSGGFTKVMSLAGGAACSSTVTAVTVAAATVAAVLTDGKLLTWPELLLPFLILRRTVGLPALLLALPVLTGATCALLMIGQTGMLVPAMLLRCSCILPEQNLLVLKLPSIFLHCTTKQRNSLPSGGADTAV